MRKDAAKAACRRGDRVEVVVKPMRERGEDGVRPTSHTFRVIGVVNSNKHCVSIKTGSKPLRIPFRDVLTITVDP